MKDQTVVITGANRGIGLALAEHCLQRQARVIALCRTPGAGLSASGAEVIDGIDVSRDDCIARVQEKLADRSVDVLINNAGIFDNDKFGELDFDRIAAFFQVNTLGALRITQALSSHLQTGAKVGLITSRMGSIADNTSGGYYAYRMSKAALNAAGMSLARDLRPRGIAVALLHPGFVRTEMVDYLGEITPEEAASGLMQRLDELTLATSGTFWHSSGAVLPW